MISARDLFDQATNTLQKPNVTNNELEKVFHDFNTLLDISMIEEDKDISTQYFHIGSTCMKRGHRAMALIMFQKALETKPNLLEAMNNIGYIYKKMHFGDEARKYFKMVIDLAESGDENYQTTDKNLSEFYTNYGSMFVANGTPLEAIEIFDKAESIMSNEKFTSYNRGLVYLELGDYERGFDGYDKGDRIDRIANRHYSYDHLPIWDGTPGKKIVVIGEQGIGDELMFATILPDVMKDCGVVLDAHPRLADMFRRSFPELDIYGTRKDDTFMWGNRYPLDAKVLIGTLPKYYRKKAEDFKTPHYLVVDKKWDDFYRHELAKFESKPIIGISWRGGTKQTGRNHRFIDLEKWLPILKLDCHFISLQYDHGLLPEIEEFNAKHGVKIHHWPEMVEDYEQTAGLVNNLDLIISVPQSVVHLAGVMGKLVWQLCPYKTLWQTGVIGQNSPWYDCVENIWQDDSCIWEPVMKQVEENLCKLLQMTIEN